MALFDGGLLDGIRNRFSAAARGEASFAPVVGINFRDVRRRFAAEFDARFASAAGRWGAFEPLPAATGLPPGSITGLPDQPGIVFRDARQAVPSVWSGPATAGVADATSGRFNKVDGMTAGRSGEFGVYDVNAKRSAASLNVGSTENVATETGWARLQAVPEAPAGLEFH